MQPQADLVQHPMGCISLSHYDNLSSPLTQSTRQTHVSSVCAGAGKGNTGPTCNGRMMQAQETGS